MAERLPLAARFGWNPRIGKTGGYYDFQTHRIVSAKEVQSALDVYTRQTKEAVAWYTQQLVDGHISLAEWHTMMREELKDAHRTVAAVEGGGWRNMTQADWGKVGARLREQYRYLDRFAEQIATGRQPLNGTARTRAGMYADAARATAEQQRRKRAAERGYTEERRRLGPAEHCVDCLTYAGMGWQPIGTLPPIGASECRTNCRCTFDFRNRQPD